MSNANVENITQDTTTLVLLDTDVPDEAEIGLDDSPFVPQKYEKASLPEKIEIGRGYAFEEVSKYTLEHFKEWASTTQIVDGRWVDPMYDTFWIRGPWLDRRIPMYLYQKQNENINGARVCAKIIETRQEAKKAPTLTPVHLGDFRDASSYAAMHSYDDHVGEVHRRQIKDVLEQINKPVVAPADGPGIVLSLSPSSICGDKNGVGPVPRETIEETYERGPLDWPLIIAYSWIFYSEEMRERVYRRIGPVVIIDESPIIIRRTDLMSIGPNVVSYGMKIVQHEAAQDNRKIRSRLPYDFNLAATYEGYDWLEWGPYLHYLSRFRPDLTHSSSRTHVSSALKLLGIEAKSKRDRIATQTIGEYKQARSSYFCPIGRFQDGVEEAYGRTQWLYSRTVYRSYSSLYRGVADEDGFFYVSSEYGEKGLIKFLPRDFRIVYSADRNEYKEKVTGFVIATGTAASIGDAVRQYMPRYDPDRARYLRQVFRSMRHILSGPLCYRYYLVHGDIMGPDLEAINKEIQIRAITLQWLKQRKLTTPVGALKEFLTHSGLYHYNYGKKEWTIHNT